MRAPIIMILTVLIVSVTVWLVYAWRKLPTEDNEKLQTTKNMNVAQQTNPHTDKASRKLNKSNSAQDNPTKTKVDYGAQDPQRKPPSLTQAPQSEADADRERFIFSDVSDIGVLNSTNVPRAGQPSGKWGDALATWLPYLVPEADPKVLVGTFDMNGFWYNFDVKLVFKGNGIPDAVELNKMYNFSLSSAEMMSHSGASATELRKAYEANYEQAVTDLGDYGGIPDLATVIAGYMTLGDFGSTKFAQYLSRKLAGKTLDVNNYDISQAEFFRFDGDIANSGESNLDAWHRGIGADDLDFSSMR